MDSCVRAVWPQVCLLKHNHFCITLLSAPTPPQYPQPSSQPSYLTTNAHRQIPHAPCRWDIQHQLSGEQLSVTSLCSLSSLFLVTSLCISIHSKSVILILECQSFFQKKVSDLLLGGPYPPSYLTVSGFLIVSGTLQSPPGMIRIIQNSYQQYYNLIKLQKISKDIKNQFVLNICVYLDIQVIWASFDSSF